MTRSKSITRGAKMQETTQQAILQETTPIPGIKVGYIRVSSLDQNTDRQLDGVELQKTFTDKCSGKDDKRPQFQAMIDYVREGDTILVHSLDRFARNLDDLRLYVQMLIKKGVKVHFVKENLSFSGEASPMSMLLLSVMGSFAEFERAIIRERQREGIEIFLKKGGKFKGRQETLTPSQVIDLRQRAVAGESKTSIAKSFKISRNAVYEYLARHAKEPLPELK
jgi:DNA invertase Pin-like site-specific DNA recombinase